MLLSKIYLQFENLYLKCKDIYNQILQTIDPKIYIHSRGSIQSIKTKLTYRSSVGMEDYLMKTTLNKISSYFRHDNNLWNFN